MNHWNRICEIERTLSSQTEAGDPWNEDMITELLETIRALKSQEDFLQLTRNRDEPEGQG